MARCWPATGWRVVTLDLLCCCTPVRRRGCRRHGRVLFGSAVWWAVRVCRARLPCFGALVGR